MKIVTSHDFPPIPDRSMDWSAHDADTYDGAPDSGTRHQIGRGKTEIDAINDLVEQLIEEAYEEGWNDAERERAANKQDRADFESDLRAGK